MDRPPRERKDCILEISSAPVRWGYDLHVSGFGERKAQVGKYCDGLVEGVKKCCGERLECWLRVACCIEHGGRRRCYRWWWWCKGMVALRRTVRC